VFRQTFAGMNPHGGAIAVGFVQLLASMLSGLLIDTVGRIPLLITSSVFMSLALASFGSFVYYEQMSKTIASNNYEMDAAVGNSDWIPLLCVLVFTIAFSLGKSLTVTCRSNRFVNRVSFVTFQESHRFRGC
jgi:facilitated trehalose transporter